MKERIEKTDGGDINNTEDVLTGRKLESILARWRTLIEVTRTRTTFRFWVASPDEKLETLLDYISSQLNLDKSEMLRIDADPRRIDVVLELENIEHEIIGVKNEKVLILVRGFEKMVQHRMKLDGRTARSGFSRIGHDYDQHIAESTKLREAFRGKKVVIVSHISPTVGVKDYESSVVSAGGSQFADGIIEIK